MAAPKKTAAVPNPPNAPQLSQALWGGVTIVAFLSTVAYAYSFGYLFRIEPQFISAFSPTDLILWAASSLYIVLVLALTAFGFALPAMSGTLREIKSGVTAARQLPWSKFYLWGAAALFAVSFWFGDHEGQAARQPHAKPRAWVCGDQANSTSCYPLIFLGSDKMVFATNGKFVLRKIEDRHWIASQGTSGYLPKH